MVGRVRWVLGLTVGLLLSVAAPPSVARSGAGASQSLSRAALARKANVLCATAKAKAQSIPAPIDLASNPAAAAAYFDRIFPITDRETRAIKALRAAPAAARDWRAFVAAQVAADQLLVTLKRKADARDPSGLADLQQVRPVGRRVARAARKVGATVCASG
jgi:hypothetical protein